MKLNDSISMLNFICDSNEDKAGLFTDHITQLKSKIFLQAPSEAYSDFVERLFVHPFSLLQLVIY